MKMLLTLLLASFSLSAAIYETDTFTSFFSACEDFSEKSLVVLDVDQVLIEPSDAILRPSNRRMLLELRTKHGSHLSSQEMAEISSISSLQDRSFLLDPDSLDFVHHIKARNIPIIALTATSVVGFGKIPSVPDWRVQDLARFGFTFDTHFQEHPFIELAQLSGKGPSPIFKSGILFTGGYPKGDVLQAFLDTVGFHPDKVLFVDDRLYNLISVTQKLETDVQAFLYLGAEKVPNSVHPEIAELQIRTLLEEERWLTDEQAMTHIEQSKLELARLEILPSESLSE